MGLFPNCIKSIIEDWIRFIIIIKIDVFKSDYVKTIIEKFYFQRFLPNHENILAISLLKSEIAKWENGLKVKG